MFAHITRRTAIRQFLVLTAVTAFVPSCLENKKKPPIALNHLDINEEQQELIAEVAETIIPRTETPGAKDISAHLFVLIMVDDCYKKKDQEMFEEGLKAFQKDVRKRFDKPFSALSNTEKEQLLTELEQTDPQQFVTGAFYAAVKQFTMQAYTTSEFYLTNVEVYELVPGRFHGCIPIQKAS